MTFKKYGIGLVVAAALGVAGSAQGAWLSEGYTVMGKPCALCDSTVTFAVWQNTDGNWLDDFVTAPTDLNGTSTGAEQYVYMYQDTDTDPNAPDSTIANLQVMFNEFGVSSISQGYFSHTSFSNRSSATTDNDPSGNDTVIIGSQAARSQNVVANPGTNLVADAAAVDPTSGSHNTPISIDQPIPGTNPDPVPGMGAFWNFFNPEIPLNGYSTVLYLTANEAPVWGMGSQRSPAGSGASGTVPVPHGVPEPTTLAMLGLGLAGLGWQRRRKSA